MRIGLQILQCLEQDTPPDANAALTLGPLSNYAPLSAEIELPEQR